MGLSGEDDALKGSFAARDLARRLMIEAAQHAVSERREPERMLRVLALLASPVYDPANPKEAPVHLDLSGEWHRLAEGVRQSGAPILLARLVPPTLPALRAALSPRAAEQSVFPQVLHFSGHAWEKGLVLEDEMGRVHSAETSEVIDALKDIPRKIDLVILNGCESAAAARSVAQALLDGGLARAVVGHEKVVRDDEAVAFAARLYSELCSGFSLKRGLENAGKEITTHKVIHLGDFELTLGPLSGGEPLIDERRPRGSLLPQAKLFLGRGLELVDMAEALAKPPSVIILSGPPGIGKSSLLLEAALRCGWRFPGGLAYAAGPRPEEAKAATAQDLVSSLAGSLGLGNAEDLFSYTAMQPTLLLLDNLDSLAGEEQVRLREHLRRLGSESAAILALRPSSEALEDLPSAVPIQLHHGLALPEAVRYALEQSAQRKIPLTQEKALLIARAVGGHPRLLEQIVAQARRKDLDGLLEDVAKRCGDYREMIEEVYSWCAARLDPEGEEAWRVLPLFPGGSAPEAVLRAATGEDGPEKLREAALADFDTSGQLWRWHATVADYARSHWPFTPDEQRTRKIALFPAWKRWLERLPADEVMSHSRLEGSRSNLEAAVEDCAGYSREVAWSFLDELDGKLPHPERTLILRELVAKAWKAMLHFLPEEEKAERARLLNNLSVALSALGRREDALTAAEEATDIRRMLAQSNPQVFLPKLAMSLNNLGPTLSDQGRREDALVAAEEAANICRTLAKDNPQTFLPKLAMSLNNLSNRLFNLGRREEALAVAEEEADIFRTLAQSNSRRFLHKLAASLNNLGINLSDQGRQENALEAAKEAADIYRNLADSSPQAFLPGLARSLGVYGNALLGLERYDEAVRAFLEGLELLAPFFRKHPQAFSGPTSALQQLYREACRKAGVEPDGDLLSKFD